VGLVFFTGNFGGVFSRRGVYPEIFREYASAVKRDEVPPHRRKYRKGEKAD